MKECKSCTGLIKKIDEAKKENRRLVDENATFRTILEQLEDVEKFFYDRAKRRK